MKNLLIILLSLSLTACGDENSNDFYEYGVLKSDPPMPPLTYITGHIQNAPSQQIFPENQKKFWNQTPG